MERHEPSTTPPSAAPAPTHPVDATSALLAFLRDRDQLCPVCRYNLRNLTRPECPECRQRLELTVGVREPTLGWFIAAIAPSVFSGIAAALLLVPIIAVPALGGGVAPGRILLLDAFGWLSGLVGLGLIARRRRFMRWAPDAQRAFAIVSWFVHAVLACLLFWAILF